MCEFIDTDLTGYFINARPEDESLYQICNCGNHLWSKRTQSIQKKRNYVFKIVGKSGTRYILYPRYRKLENIISIDEDEVVEVKHRRNICLTMIYYMIWILSFFVAFNLLV